MRIAVPNPVVRDWILSTYASALNESLLELRLEKCRIEWMLPANKVGRSEIPSGGDGARSSLGDPVTRLNPNEVPLNLPSLSSSPLNEKYTFDTFVVASCNRFAHAATQAVAESPARLITLSTFMVASG